MDINGDCNLENLLLECKIAQNFPSEKVIDSLILLKSRLNEQELITAFNCFFEKETNPKVLIYIIKTLDQHKNEKTFGLLVDFLITKKQNTQEYAATRVMTIKAIANYKRTDAMSSLLYCLNSKDEDYKVRLACAEALGKIGDRNAVTPLINIVSDEGEKSVYVRESAAHALGMIGDNNAIDPLISILETKKGFADKFTYLKERVIEALGRLNSSSDKVFRALESSLNDEAPHIRIGAIEALMNSDDDRAIPLIRKMLNDKDREVTKNAIVALYNMIGESALQEIISSEEFSESTKAAATDVLKEIESDEDDER